MCMMYDPVGGGDGTRKFHDLVQDGVDIAGALQLCGVPATATHVHRDQPGHGDKVVTGDVAIAVDNMAQRGG